MAKQATQQSTAPAVEQPLSPAQAAYQPVVRPARGAKWLTFEYGLAMFSVVASLVLSTQVLVAVFGLWVGTSKVAGLAVGSWLSDTLGLWMITPGTSLITVAVLAVLLAVLALVLFGRVSRTVPERQGYTDSLAYKLITYGGVAALVVAALVLVAKLVSILISSLLFIGIPNAGAVYGSLYLAEFLPYLVGLALLAAGLWAIGSIVCGRNRSKVLAFIAIAATGALLLTASITVAVQLHSNETKTTTRYQLED